MTVKYKFGKSIPRFEDARYLTGQASYTSDIKVPNMVFARMLRSHYPAGRIAKLDVSAAKEAEGVITILTYKNVAEDKLGTFKPLISRKKSDGLPNYVPPCAVLANNAVKYVGDIIAAVIADTEINAENALELITLVIDPTPAVTNTKETTQVDSPAVWSEEPSNNCFVERLGDDQATETAFLSAAAVISREYIISRVIAHPMEPRSAIGLFNSDNQSYTLYAGLQTPHIIRDQIANNILQINPNNLRVIAPDMGGGFGLKASAQRELAIVLWAAKRVNRPVCWISGRSESFIADNHARDNVSEVSLAVDKAGKFLALRVKTLANLGAYIDTFGLHIPVGNLGGLAGPYIIGSFDIEVRGMFSNTQPTAPYRGAGRPEATYCIERIIDSAAHELGICPVEIRRKNMIPPALMPFDTGLTFKYDCGEFENTMDMALSLSDYNGIPGRARNSLNRGRLHGHGIAYAVEIAGGPQGDPLKEYAKLEFDNTGHANLFIGTHNHGQGHETAYRQLLYHLMGIDPNQLTIICGDTMRVAKGIGTFGSRSIGIGGAAISKVSANILQRAHPVAAEILEVSPDDVEFINSKFCVRGTDYGLSMHELAKKAATLYPQNNDQVPMFTSETMEASEDCTFPNGCHICEVEIDPDTGEINLTRYTVVDDVGRVLNPLLLEGQIHGGVAQGVGQAIYESIQIDSDSGQLVSGSLMDYCLPRADNLPMFSVKSHEVLTEKTPFGTKGAGEAGTVGSIAAVMNAISNALIKVGAPEVDMPATSEKVWKAFNKRKYA